MIFLAIAISLVAGVPDPIAAEAFERVVETTRNAAPVRVESTLRLESRIGKVVESSDEHKSVYVLDAPDRALIRSGDWRWLAIEGELISTHANDGTAYVRFVHEGTPLDAIRSQVVSMPDPYLAMAVGADRWDVVCTQLHDVSLGLVPVAVEEDGRRLRLQGVGASMTLMLDAVGRPESCAVDLEGTPGLPDGVRVRWSWSWSHVSLSPDELEAALLFERRDRKRVDSVLSLRMKRQDTAPESSTDSASSEGGQ